MIAAVLGRQRLHVGVRQFARIGQHGQRIAAEADFVTVDVFTEQPYSAMRVLPLISVPPSPGGAVSR